MKKKGEMRRRKATMKGTNVEDKVIFHKLQDNRINQLPDDILISIISRLPLREATATCLLSTRWQHLYNYTTHLHLPPFEAGTGRFYQYLEQVQDDKFSNHVGMINRILDSYKACQVLKEFYVHMPCFAGADIERWLDFAFARKVQVLDMLSNVPKLSDFSTNDNYQNTLAEILFGIPFCIHDQLQQLKLDTCTGLIRANLPTYMLPNLVNLKHLKLEVYIDPHDTSALFPLIEACRSLETVDIKFLWVENWTKFEGGEISVRPPRKKLSPNLKKVKLSAYRGSNEDLEFAAFIMKNTVSLQELIVEPCEEPRRIRRAATARAYHHLLPLKPHSAKLLII